MTELSQATEPWLESETWGRGIEACQQDQASSKSKTEKCSLEHSGKYLPVGFFQHQWFMVGPMVGSSVMSAPELSLRQ